MASIIPQVGCCGFLSFKFFFQTKNERGTRTHRHHRRRPAALRLGHRKQVKTGKNLFEGDWAGFRSQLCESLDQSKKLKKLKCWTNMIIPKIWWFRRSRVRIPANERKNWFHSCNILPSAAFNFFKVQLWNNFQNNWLKWKIRSKKFVYDVQSVFFYMTHFEIKGPK